MMEETLQEPGNQLTLKEPIHSDSRQKDLDEIVFLTKQICKVSAAVLYFYESLGTRTSLCGLRGDVIPFPGYLHKNAEAKIIYREDFQRAFREPPAIGGYSFYAGLPLITAQNETIGILYVLNYDEKKFSSEQKESLIYLGNQILRLLDYGKQHNELRNVQHKLRQKYNDLEKFASVVSHDIKSPLANIISLTEFLKEENQGVFNKETTEYFEFLTQSSYSLRNYVDGILTFYRSDNILEKEKEDVDIHQLLQGIANLYQMNSDVQITYPTTGILHKVNKAALTQIFLNLISNALKYNGKQERKVAISFREEEEFYFFKVEDNGNGILQKDFGKIFELFTTLDQNDRDGHPGSGIGLATVRKMVDHMQGSIEVTSTVEKGTSFSFRIKRK